MTDVDSTRHDSRRPARHQRVLVLGATGHFGTRICRALARSSEVELHLGARRREPLEQLAATLSLGADRIVVGNINAASIADWIRSNDIGVVVHTVGPFQGQSYELARAAINAGAHYIDLADGRDFTVGFAAALDTDAKRAGIVAISGASTLPALSSAVIDDHASAFDRLECIEIVIAPAQRTPRGPATVDAVLSYCGRPISWLESGQWRTAYGWQSLRRLVLPGIGTRWAAACDVPDLALLPLRYPSVQTVQFRAALELGVQHFGLWLVAAGRRIWPRLPIAPLAPRLAAIGRLLDRFGGERGGMTIKMSGMRDGTPIERTWCLVADANEGPEIPCLAAEILALRLARGEAIAPGARTCMGLVTLAEFEQAFRTWPFRSFTLDERGRETR